MPLNKEHSNKALLKNKEAIATPLLAIVIDKFGLEAFEWEPEMLNAELESYAGGEVPETNKDKVQALMIGMSDERAWNNTLLFSYIANSLGGEDKPIIPGSMDVTTPYEIAWTIVELMLNDPPETSVKERMGKDIRNLIKYWFNANGLVLPPSPFEWLEIDKEEIESISKGEEGTFGAQTVYQHHENAKVDVEQYVQTRFTKMINQLKEITLEKGDTSNLDKLDNFST